MFDSTGADITNQQQYTFSSAQGEALAVLSLSLNNQGDNSSIVYIDLCDTSGNRISSLPTFYLDSKESIMVENKIFVSNGKSLKFTTDSDINVSVTLSYAMM